MSHDPAIDLLRDLVAIDSVNPSLVPGAAGEAQIASAIAAHLRQIGLDVHIQEVAPGRPNVIGVLEGQARGRSLMFCGHIDTVGVEGMEAPFAPAVRAGRLYGRGSQDMKGGVAAMIDAARLTAERGLSRGRLIVAAVVDEEFASIGADALVKEWSADGAVVTEPTDLQVGVGHKGFAWIDIETHGRAAHGSRPRDGRDAIMRMGRVLRQLETLDRELQARSPHPLMGSGSLHASIISGGRELSSYPDRCRLQIERRTIGAESGEAALQEVLGILDGLSREDAEFEASAVLAFSRPPYELVVRSRAAAATGRSDAVARERPRCCGYELLDRRRGAWRGGHPDGPLRARRRGPSQPSRNTSTTDDVVTCRDALSRLALSWC